MKTASIVSLLVFLATYPAFASDQETVSAYAETGLVANSGKSQAAALCNFCLDSKDNLLTCDQKEKVVRVIGSDGSLTAVWPAPFAPQAIAARPDGTTIIAGAGNVALLDNSGKLLVSAELPVPPIQSTGDKNQDETTRLYLTAATSVACSADDIFVCARANTGYNVYRFNKQLKNITPIIKGLRGCCGQMCIATNNGFLYAAVNGEFQVVKYDRDGNKLSSFGSAARSGGEAGFSPCCNPMNICFGPSGELFTSEATACCIKQFTTEGKFIGTIGKSKIGSGCTRVTIAITSDRQKLYVLDEDKNVIHVLTAKKGMKL